MIMSRSAPADCAIGRETLLLGRVCSAQQRRWHQ
jgi:hypothetical protein